jgi:hypothetical protein
MNDRRLESARGERSDAVGISHLHPQLLDTWKKYEDIAMHFNDLIMRWRLQAAGGLAALATVGGSTIGTIANDRVRYWGLLLLAITLGFLWSGIAIIDLFYYRRLLTGAVRDLLELEKQIPLKLSCAIERDAGRGSETAPFAFYVLAAVPLVIGLVYAITMLQTIE